MPLINYICAKCGLPTRKIVASAGNAAAEIRCQRCDGVARRRQLGAHAQVFEVIDNGLQARATVRPADAQRIMKEREVAADQKYSQEFDEDDFTPIDTQGSLV